MRAAEKAHASARMLSSTAIDDELAPSSAVWLAAHLRGCEECRLVAEEYRAIHAELRGLATPEPPRDLWARTASGLDAIDRASARRLGRAGLSGLRLGGFARNRSSLGSVMAVAIAVVVIGVSLLSQGPLFVPRAVPSTTTSNLAAATVAPSAGPQAAVALVDGTSYWVGTENGVYQIKGGTTHCTGSPSSCAVTNGNGTIVGSIASKTPVSVIISPSANSAAVWNATKVVILPLTQSAPKTVAIDQLTPRPAGPVATAAATVSATADVASPAASTLPDASASPTVQPVVSSAPATPVPPAATPATGPQPTAILDGYKIVGRAPEFSANGVWVAFSARSVSQTTGSDVFVWRVGWERAKAVTTGHADLFAGWFGSRILISEFSQSNSGAGATAAPSAPADATDVPATAAPVAGTAATIAAISYLYDPASEAVRRIGRPMLMPVIDPTGRFIVYWSGTVEFDTATGLYGPGDGDFYFDAWSNIDLVAARLGDGGGQAPTPAPTPVASVTAPAVVTPTDAPSPVAFAGDAASLRVAPVLGGQSFSQQAGSTGMPQRIPIASAPGTVTSWCVRWDATGQYVAIWVADAGAADAGHVTLLNVIPGTNLLNVDGLLLSTSARSNIQFDDSQFVYTSPTQGGQDKTYLFRLPAVPPAPSAPPETAAPAAPGSGQPGATGPLPVSTDRPGN